MPRGNAGQTTTRPVLGTIYLWLVAVTGIIVLAAAAWGAPWPAPTQLGMAAELLLLAAIAQHFPLPIGRQHKVDTSIVVYFACLLLFDLRAALVVIGACQVVGQFTLALRRDADTGRRLRGARGILFNTSQVVVATALGGLVYGLLVPHSGPAPMDRVENLWAIPIAALAVQLSNSLAVALMVALQLRHSPREVWVAVWRIRVLERAALFLVAVVTVLAAGRYLAAPLLMALPTALLFLSQRRALAVLAREQQARTDAEQAQRHLAFLANASAVLASSLDYETTLQSAARLAVPPLADWCTVIVGREEGACPRIAVAHTDAQQQERLRQLLVQRPINLSAEERGHAAVFPAVREDQLRAWAPDDEWLGLLRDLQPASAMTVPLVAHGRRLGAVALYATSCRQRYGAGDLVVAEDLAVRIALALDNARMYEEQQRIVGRLEQLRGQLEATERERLLDDERRRIARELHDRVEQTFFSIGLTVSAALGSANPPSLDRLRAALGSVRAAASQGSEDLRAAIFALTRAEVHDRGLVRVLWRLVRQFQQTTGLEADLVVSGAERRVPPDVAEVLQAVAREGLANVEQHARASAVVVSLGFEPDAAVLTVQDDGVGASTLVLSNLAESATRFGVQGIRERVRRLGGSLTAEPGDEGGFVVRARVPVVDAAP